MQKAIKIFPIQQYIINQVRVERHNLGMSAEELSLKVSTSTSLIGTIESPSSPTTYTDHMLNKIASVLTERSKALGNHIDYTLHDFYPIAPLSDLPERKIKIKLAEKDGLTSTLNIVLVTTDFLNDPRTIREITDYFNMLRKGDWKSNNLTSTLDFAVQKGTLKKTEVESGRVLYQKV